MRVMITGAAGFIGGFLAKRCVAANAEVLGIGGCDPEDQWIGAAFERCDIRDRPRLLELISTFRPDQIFHLAAQSYPTVSLAKPLETMEINAGGTINLYECLRALDLSPTVVVACSSAEYGIVAQSELPTRETHALRPMHPYGVSKVAQDLLAAQYFANYGIPSVRIRIFNTTGPGKQGDVCSDLARRAVEIELGLRPPVLMVGNLSSRRAIIDVRDMVEALCLAAERAEAGEVYNVGSDAVYSVEDLITTIRMNVTAAFTVQQDPKLMRRCDEPVIVGDITKFQCRTGWRPGISLPNTLRDMVAWWRQRIAGAGTTLAASTS